MLSLLLASGLIIILKNIYLLSLILLALIILIPKNQTTWFRVKPLLLISFLIVVLQPQHLYSAVSAALRILTLSLLVFYYTSITSPSKIVSCLSFLPQSWQLMLTITLSLIPAILDEAKKISLIQTSRGIKSYNPLPLLVPLLHRILQRSQQLTLAIENKSSKICNNER